MGDVYYTILQEGRDEFTISRSRFICRSAPVSTEEEALTYIDRIRKEHWDANHNVWAYVLGSQKERYSDDGEPKGTAGIPALEVIRKEGLRDALVVVTRYFGGIKLGAGGLTRAYAQGAKIALQAGKIIERRPFSLCSVTVEYALAGRLKREFSSRNYILKDTIYLDQVTLIVLVPPEQQEPLNAIVAEVTAGKGVLAAKGEEYLDFWQEGTQVLAIDN